MKEQLISNEKLLSMSGSFPFHDLDWMSISSMHVSKIAGCGANVLQTCKYQMLQNGVGSMEYVPRWQTIDKTFTIDKVTQTYSCRKATCKSCKCIKSGLACLPSCRCEKSCEKWFVIHHYSVSFLFIMSYDNVSLLLILYSLLIAAHFTFAWFL